MYLHFRRVFFFFKATLQEQVKSCHWLQLKAANGLSIPYIGYVELDDTVLGKTIPKRGWLTVKDPPEQNVPSSLPGVLGMNVIWHYEFREHGPAMLDCPISLSEPWQQALHYCHRV